MLVCAIAAAYSALPESARRIVPEWRPAVTALLAALSALALITYPTWGELKNPGLWMFAIVAAVAGAAPGYWLRFDIDHSWSLIRLQKAYDGFIAAAGLISLALLEITLAAIGPADQPTMELGLTVVAFSGGPLGCRAAALQAGAAVGSARQPLAAGRRIVVMQPADCSHPAGRVGLSGRPCVQARTPVDDLSS